MPTKQGVGLDEEPSALRPGDQPAEASKERAVLRLQSRTVHLATEDGHLVSKDNDLDGQIGVVGPLQEEDLDGPDEGEIEKGESHGSFCSPPMLWRKFQISNVEPSDLGSPGRAKIQVRRARHGWPRHCRDQGVRRIFASEQPDEVFGTHTMHSLDSAFPQHSTSSPSWSRRRITPRLASPRLTIHQRNSAPDGHDQPCAETRR
jgi:hypothetical protein